MKYIVITGAARGIGLGLTKHYLDRGDQVLAVVRQGTLELEKLQEKFPKLSVFKGDLAGEEVFSQLAQHLLDWPHLDLLINNAGVLHEKDSYEDFVHSFKVNTIAPFFVLQALKNKLKQSTLPVSVNISSVMGSITENASGGFFSYRSSKAALNMVVKSLSLSEPWLISIAIHPGWVKTRMGGMGAMVSVETSVTGITHLVEKISFKESGRFFDYQGNERTW